MNFNELSEEQQDLYQEAYSVGYDDGWGEGYDQAVLDLENDEQNHIFKEGVLAEQERVRYILNMMFESSLNLGKGNDAVWYRNIMELLTPAVQRDDFKEDEDF